MENYNLHNSLRHSRIFIFLLGGLLGACMNFAVSLSFHTILLLNPFISFFFGTLCNELFHHIYYYVVFKNREIRLKTPFYIQFTLYLCVAVAGLFILWFYFVYMNLTFIFSLFLSIASLSLLSALFVKISAFSSAELAHVEYTAIDENYYKELTDTHKFSRFRSWYHSSRFKKLTFLIEGLYRPEMKIVDLGCGNCLWNEHHLPVIGVDINKQMLQWAQKEKYITHFITTDNLAKTDLPSKSFDIVIMSETLEHLINIEDVLSEVSRILKDNGTFIITVPYDFFLGPFFLLFNLNCLYTGFIKGSRYHQYRCGHINHFTKRRLRSLLKQKQFAVSRLYIVNGLLIYATAQKVIASA